MGLLDIPNSLVLLRFDEDENENGTFTDASEDQYSLEVPVTWEGWKAGYSKIFRIW